MLLYANNDPTSDDDNDDILLNISNLYADAEARSMTPSRNTRSYTLRSVPSFPGRSLLICAGHLFEEVL